jgi:hypothetical protein
MASRADLQTRLCEVLGSKNVYYQPPENFKLSYPCIVYESNKKDINYANDRVYTRTNSYTLTLIYKTADYELVDKILDEFVLIRHDRTFKSDNLYHDVYNLYW